MHVFKFGFMSVLQGRTYTFFTSSTLYLFYKFDLMSVLQVRPNASLIYSTLCLSYKLDLIARPYACFTSSTLYLFIRSTSYLFYKFDLMSVLQIRPYAPLICST